PEGGAGTLAPTQEHTTQAQKAEPKTIILGGAPETSIHPFSFHASDDDLVDLKRRIAATRWPERELVDDASQGVQLATIRKLADYWLNHHDWRKVEARINSYPNFITNIDGVDIHFIHVKSKHANALPIIITHGWPGSVIEQLKVIDPLTDPTSHGGKAEDAFDVVIPSMPGYGFSGKPTMTGWGPEKIASAWAKLMNRLGYTRYVAQGGDWGAQIVDFQGVQAAPELVGIHTNMAGAIPPEIDALALQGAPAPAGLDAEERASFDHVSFFYKHGLGYANEMGNRPQTLYALEDSPIGLAAWIIDHDIWTYKQIARVFDGEQLGLTRDDIVDNITLYWLTRTAVSSARLYWENHNAFFAFKGVKIPVVVSAFPEEIPGAIPRKWAEQAYPRLIYYKKHPEGAHFAAWEQPDALVDDMREGFRSLRN
ncbi:MAG TPA: epoxide hydrolase, partial [Sphingomicrobium sp.]|nr:epoxide hydrolase [Sphingomicrobium sp.]